MKVRSIARLSIAGLLLPAGAALADSITLVATRDNTLYESATGALSNGAGQYFFAGRNAAGDRRRGLVAFDLSSVPSGATVTGVVLTLHLSQTLPYASPIAFELHRALAAWGEGTSNATSGGGGAGVASTPGDATWIHTFYPTSFWASPGGDFAPAASASQGADAVGSYAWGSTPQLVADVQGWLADPSSNFGWVLLGDESTFPTSKRFDTRENLQPAFRPGLSIEFMRKVGVEPATWSRVLELYR